MLHLLLLLPQSKTVLLLALLHFHPPPLPIQLI